MKEKVCPERRRYLRYRNQFRRILRTCERYIKLGYPLFGLCGIATRDVAVVDEVIRSPRLLELMPDYAQTRRYWTRGGLRGFLREFQPMGLDDLALANALHRPGPIASGMANRLLQRKERTPSHASLVPILTSTGGFLVYREQLIELAKTLAGFTTAEAVQFPRALREQAGSIVWKAEFLRRCAHNRVGGRTAKAVFDQIADEGRYAISRAWSYEAMGCLYSMAYLKTYYQVEFRQARRAVLRKPSEFV